MRQDERRKMNKMRPLPTYTLAANYIQNNIHTHTTMMMNRQRRSNMVLVNTNYSVQLINMHEDEMKASHSGRGKAAAFVTMKNLASHAPRRLLR